MDELGSAAAWKSTLDLTDGAIYLEGSFNHVGGAERRHVAAVDTRRALLPWAPDPAELEDR